MTRIPSSSTIKFHSRLWKRREGKYSFQYWPFRESGWNKKTVSWIFLQKNLITVYRINQSLENAIVTAPFYVLHARDTREEGGRGRRGARPKFRENSWKRPRRETRRGTNDNDVPKTIDIDRAIEGKWWKNMQSRGGERREGGRERRGEKWRGEEEIGGGEDDKKREKEGGWMAERYGIWEMRTRFFSFFLFFFLFFFFLFFFPPPSGRQSRFTGFLTSVANIFGVIIAWFSDARAIVNDHGEGEMARRGSGKTCRAVYDRFIRWW